MYAAKITKSPTIECTCTRQALQARQNSGVVAEGSGASPGFGRGGPRFLFQIWEFTCREA